MLAPTSFLRLVSCHPSPPAAPAGTGVWGMVGQHCPLSMRLCRVRLHLWLGSDMVHRHLQTPGQVTSPSQARERGRSRAVPDSPPGKKNKGEAGPQQACRGAFLHPCGPSSAYGRSAPQEGQSKPNFTPRSFLKDGGLRTEPLTSRVVSGSWSPPWMGTPRVARGSWL